jgi:hypothetical protein
MKKNATRIATKPKHAITIPAIAPPFMPCRFSDKLPVALGDVVDIVVFEIELPSAGVDCPGTSI